MAEKVASDIQVYDGLAWKGMVGQKVYDGANWKDFQGVYDGTDWWKQADEVTYYAELINDTNIELTNLQTDYTFGTIDVNNIILEDYTIDFDLVDGGYIHLGNMIPKMVGLDKISMINVTFDPLTVVRRRTSNIIWQVWDDAGTLRMVLMTQTTTAGKMRYRFVTIEGYEVFSTELPTSTMNVSSVLNFETSRLLITSKLSNGNLTNHNLAVSLGEALDMNFGSIRISERGFYLGNLVQLIKVRVKLISI